MKKIIPILFSLACSYSLNSQQYLLQQFFDNGNNLPASWELKLDSPYTSPSNSGSSVPALKFSATGHYLITPTFSGATDLSFWLKGVSTDTLSTFIIEGMQEGEWIEIARLCPISRTGKQYQIELPVAISRLRFSYIKSAGNVAFDDLLLSRPSRPPLILSYKMTKIKDYLAETEIVVDTAGTIVYLVLPDSVGAPNITQMLNFEQYPFIHDIADSGHIKVSKNVLNLVLTNLAPLTQYRLYLLATGSKNNVLDGAKLQILSFTTLKLQPMPFFSAIVKGKTNNKAIAIYNPTPDTINLSEYRIAMSTNGGGWLTSYFTFKTGTLLFPYSQYLIMKNTADSLFKASYPADTLTGGRIINFTGNDARALQRTINKGKSWFTTDIYGLANQATDFAIAGISGAAGKYNLYRKRHIHTGNTSWAKSAGTDSINSEWILSPLTDYSMLLQPFAKIRQKLIFKSLLFTNTSPVTIRVDTFQQQIHVIFPDTVNLTKIVWNVELDPHIIMVPKPSDLCDFTANFSFRLIDTSQCDTSLWNFRIKTTATLIEEIPYAETLSIYPNPVREFLQISGISNHCIKEVKIYTSNGKIVETFTHFPISTHHLSEGIYCIKIYLINKQTISRFFVKSP